MDDIIEIFSEMEAEESMMEHMTDEEVDVYVKERYHQQSTDKDDSFWDVYQKEVTDAAREECTREGMI